MFSVDSFVHKKIDAMPREEEEPASPTARLMQAKQFNLSIIALLGFNTQIDPTLFKNCIQHNLPKHPRFSCILVKEKGKCCWRRTKVDIDDHIVIVPDLDPNMESSDEFVEDFTSNLSKIPMDTSKPLWELHIVNVKTSDAKATVIFKVHHSMGDGVSLVALLQACSTNISDLQPLPLSSSNKDKNGALTKTLFVLVSTMFWVVLYTLIDCALFLATILFLKDRQSPIKSAGKAVLPYKRFVHRIVGLDDVKFVKNAMNVSINDVVLGFTEAGLARYLHTRSYAHEKNRENGAEMMKKNTTSLPAGKLRLRSAVVLNLRPTPTIKDLTEMMEKEELNGMWGNMIGIVLLPLTVDVQDDPLTHVRRAKSNMDKKKLSLGHKCSFFVMKLIMMLFGTKAAASVVRKILKNTTLTFSNVMGPQEEVNLFGHPLAYIAPSVYGVPQSLIVHCQSYSDKLIISIGADEKLIPYPHQLCDDLVKSLQNIKETVIKRGLIK